MNENYYKNMPEDFRKAVAVRKQIKGEDHESITDFI